MNGADMLCDVLLVNNVDVCFANPGTSEMHFVAALDRKPAMRCVLGLSEGVVTGAADGYARMADKPAATLLHTGPGLANGLANLHNARRARTPIINVVGDHATYHLAHDAPLTSDIESLARPMSHWVGRIADAADVRARTEEAYMEALMRRGVSTMILPANAAWGDVKPEALSPVTLPERPAISSAALSAAATALRDGKRTVIILAGRALRANALETAGRISVATGAALFSQTSDRTERGAGRVAARPIPYNVDQAIAALRQFEVAICVGGKQPVSFFAYPGKPSTMLQPDCKVIELAGHESDLAKVLDALAEEIGIRKDSPFAPNRFTQHEIAAPTGELNADSISVAVAHALPENAIICEESITSAGRLAALAPGLKPHDHIPLTGGAIGEGIPLAVGAGIACPDRKVIALQADGSGMYTIQGLWTQAREDLDVLTIVFSNRGYSILKGEMRNVGVNDFGRNARRMLEIVDPALDWCSLARGMGVEAARAESADQFTKLLNIGLSRRGPFLIEALMAG
ncbi:acetolactate synthase-1/2/3 large subunit [Mesorhizobium sp. J18]|uniref:acetolactate synthase large subunit n=1 Tax=Mesorhizobium sp. J18 TaxID=935263 RepID=UPI00119B3F10|nr:acetolactate synthase large subunit [Mesorhizobium sp. J18]TWG91783.1 acetolactate synthase-1/2/3 large subunit [Mesorhizobium sp. J18]